MSKKLRFWNGRCVGQPYGGNNPKYRMSSMNVAAYSRAEAARLMGVSANEVKDYFSECWGNDMIGIVATEPCMYVTYHDENNKQIQKKLK